MPRRAASHGSLPLRFRPAPGGIPAALSSEPPIDLRSAIATRRERRARGKALRSRAPRKHQGVWRAPVDRPNPLGVLEKTNRGRIPELIPLRMGRMAASRFGYLRGSAAMMAWDLAHTPASGIHVLLDGDAHLSNFGLFGTVERDVVFDLDDFDESIPGPWEWDLKRLLTSVEIAGRDLGFGRAERDAALEECLRGYRDEIWALENVGSLDLWYRFLFGGRKGSDIHLDPETRRIVQEASAKAAQRTNQTLLDEVAEQRPDGAWELREEPPIQTRIARRTRAEVVAALDRYTLSLPQARRHLLERYHVLDVARHVVGVGSVGTRVYLALLLGIDAHDPLFLQVKEATVPAATPYLPPLPRALAADQGQRVVAAQMALVGSPDILLGWTQIGGRSFYVRQMRNMKGSVPLTRLGGHRFPHYVRACGAILGRAHARTGDAAMIVGYWGASRTMDDAFVRFARSYADQVEADHAALVRAVSQGKVAVAPG